jgi:hypothetical protein
MVTKKKKSTTRKMKKKRRKMLACSKIKVLHRPHQPMPKSKKPPHNQHLLALQ